MRRLLLLLFTVLLCVTAVVPAFAFYNPGTGRWVNKDPMEENGGVNPYAFCINYPVGGIDPLGLERFKIWASAFIPDTSFLFPYPPYANLALWSGDGRTTATVGGSSRAFHYIIIETDPSKSPSIENFSGAGITTVKYFNTFGIPRVVSASDTVPPKATITRSSNNKITTVEFAADTKDPLIPLGLAPSLHYQYKMVFDVCKGQVKITGSRKQYPAYDLILNSGVLMLYLPTGLANFPGALIAAPTDIKAITMPIQTYP